MTKSAAIPLFVDLDGTLIKTDSMLEAIVALVRTSPLAVFEMFAWLFGGRAQFKDRLANRVMLDAASLPLNEEFINFLEGEKKNGRSMILISASNQHVVDIMHAHFPYFTKAIGSDTQTNLKGREKLKRIQLETEGQSFAYAGDSNSDIPIWEEAAEIVLVNCHTVVSDKVQLSVPDDKSVLEFDKPTSRKINFFKGMRPHQWLKNTLVFLPLILSHQLGNPALLVSTIIGFISFSLCASSVYLINDMLDINNDRAHKSKTYRPFAASALPLRYGFVGAPLLFLSSIILASVVSSNFLQALLFYWLITCLYSLFLKKIFLLDVVTLSFLFTMRVVAGSAAIGVITTSWLITFTGFLFLGLAMLKRVVELSNLRNRGEKKAEGRSYSTDQISLLAILGIMASSTAIIVFTVYINAPDTTKLYTSPTTLWAICPLLIMILARIWRAALAGKLSEDPVLFALEDRPSQLLLGFCGLFLWLAT